MHVEQTTSENFIPLSITKILLKEVASPLLVIILILSCYYSFKYFSPSLIDESVNLSTSIYLTTLSLITGCIYWFFLRILNVFKRYLLSTNFFSKHAVTSIVLPFLISLLKTIIFLMLINIIIPYLGVPKEFEFFAGKISSIFIIIGIAWLLFRLVHTGERLILNYYTIKTSNDVTARKMYTQMLILKRLIMILILVLAAGSTLMLFENVRSLGASVLTTAGVIGLLLTFTAQRSLPSIFAGLEIALAQPIKIGDNVVVENETGVIEEINFRYVILKLWDWRRFVVPTTYFLEKPFQNLSREQSTNLIGTVFMYVDFTLPLDALREEFKKILESSSLWDRKISKIQVSDLKEHTMELRILASAASPAHTWDLRCEIREKLITFITTKYPTCLPIERVRNSNSN